MYDRIQEHWEDLANMENSNALVKHQLLHYQGEEPDFSFTLHRSWKTSLARQIGEAIQIANSDQDLLMNSRSEWGQNRVPRVQVHEDSRNPGATSTSPTPASMPRRPSASTSNTRPDGRANPDARMKTALQAQNSPRGTLDGYFSKQSNPVVRNEQVRANLEQSQAEIRQETVNRRPDRAILEGDGSDPRGEQQHQLN